MYWWERANRDVNEAVAYDLEEGARGAALGFVDALERVYDHVSRHPAAGSPRHAGELNLPGLRHWPVKGYPHLVFYVEHEGHIDVWRVLHAHRDIPAWMQDA